MGPKTIDSQTLKDRCLPRNFHGPQNARSLWPIIVQHIGLKMSHKVLWAVHQIRPRNETKKFEFPIRLENGAIWAKFGGFSIP